MSQWFKAYVLKSNSEKTQFIHFKTQNKNNYELNVEVDGNAIKTSDSTKFLGLNIQKNLKWGGVFTNPGQEVKYSLLSNVSFATSN